MIPAWMKQTDNYSPSDDGSRFAVDSIQAIGRAMSRIKMQKGHEKERTMPPLFKLFLMVFSVLLVSVTQSRLIVLAVAAVILGYLCTWPAKDIWPIIKGGLTGSALALLILLPSMIVNSANPTLIRNEIFVVVKVFFCVESVSIFNHTTQWNHVTGALKKLHIPGIFIFTLDITLKYIVLLGNLINDLLTSLQLRSVGKNDKKYTSVGGVMGITFIRGVEMNREMYDAMQCRGFTDDYKGLDS